MVGNRFLSGTRAVISFFVGLSSLPIAITLPLCAASALLWNSLLVFAGFQLGRDWRSLAYYLNIYGAVIIALVAIIAIYFIFKFYFKRRQMIQRESKRRHD